MWLWPQFSFWLHQSFSLCDSAYKDIFTADTFFGMNMNVRGFICLADRYRDCLSISKCLSKSSKQSQNPLKTTALLWFSVTFKSLNAVETPVNQTWCEHLFEQSWNWGNCDYEYIRQGVCMQSEEALWSLLSLWNIYDRCSAVKRLLTLHLPFS